MRLVVNGAQCEVSGEGSLLDALREECGLKSVKDGCAPQGQCGCCTVLVDGRPRVSCVTPVRRVQDREVTTVEGLDPLSRKEWSEAFLACGASQCGFCTPGIVLRLQALRQAGGADGAAVRRALAAHMCRCTGWLGIEEAFDVVGTDVAVRVPAAVGRDLDRATQRATLEAGVAQHVDAAVVLGEAMFADDSAPDDALVAVSDGAGGWVVAESLTEARARAGRVQGRRTTLDALPTLEVAARPGGGAWDVTLATSWVEPAYVEPDSAWCRPGEEPVGPLTNGGAFGGKASSIVTEAARELAARHGRAVRVLLSREDVVRFGAKRPPLALGLDGDGRGILRVVRTPGVVELVGRLEPGLVVEEVDLPGPPTSLAIRSAVRAELVMARAALSGGVGRLTDPAGGSVEVDCSDGRIALRVDAGDPLDEIVLRSYCIGAAHMALGWVTSEGITVTSEGPQDLTIRSFGVLPARDTPQIDVDLCVSEGPPVAVSATVFAAVAAEVWVHQGSPCRLPTGMAFPGRG